jgi:hypothetical protein
MAGEDVEVAVRPRVVSGNALQDDVSGEERDTGEQGSRSRVSLTWFHRHLSRR